MRSFAYQAIDGDGRSVSGTVMAASRDAAMTAVRNLGQRPTDIVEAQDETVAAASRPTIPASEVAALMRELAYRNDGTFVGLSEFE